MRTAAILAVFATCTCTARFEHPGHGAQCRPRSPQSRRIAPVAPREKMPPLQQTQGNRLSYKVPGFVDEAHQSVPPASLVIEHQRAAHPRHPWLARKQTDTFPQTTTSALHRPFASSVRPTRRIGAPELPLSAEGTGRPPVCMQAIVALSSPPFIHRSKFGPLTHGRVCPALCASTQAAFTTARAATRSQLPSCRHRRASDVAQWRLQPRGLCYHV